MSRPEAPARPDSLRAVLGAAILFFSVLLVFASVKSHRDLVAASDHQRDLERTIHDTRERIELLRGRIDRLRHDPDTLERLAREDLGMVRATDVVLVLPPPAPARSLAAPARQESPRSAAAHPAVAPPPRQRSANPVPR